MKDNNQFTEQELKFINADIFDTTNDIYATILINGQYSIYATLPSGWYKFNIANDELLTCLKHLRQDGISTNMYHGGIIIHLTNTQTAHIVVKNNRDEIVKELRKQAILNSMSSKRKTKNLVEKAIQRRNNISIKHHGQKSDLGQAYNLKSLYETANECLAEDITIELDESKPTTDLVVRYLRAIKLKQDMMRLEAKQQASDEEKLDIEKHQNELFKK